MNFVDLEKAVTWIETRWGRTNKWDRFHDLYSDFAPYTAGALKQALYQLYRGGQKYPPGPPELLKTVSEVQQLRVARGEDDIPRACNGDHTWAAPLPFDEDRHVTCVLCGETGGIWTHTHHWVNGCCAYCPDKETA